MAASAQFTGTLILQDGTVKDATVASGTAIDADKLQHMQVIGTDFGLDSDATPTAQTKTIYQAGSGGATIRGFKCFLTDTGTSTDVDFDLLINGVSALSGVVNITHAAGDRASQSGTLSTTALSSDEVLTVDLAITSTTGAQGPYAYVILEENART